MNHYLRLICTIFFVLLASCETIQPNAIWRDPSYQSHPAKVLVVGVSKSAVTRRLFEEEFVRQLNARGTQAVASYSVLPDKAQNDQALITEKMKSLGADTLLITRQVSKKTMQIYVPGTVYYPPPHYGTWRKYYGYGYQAISTPGYMTENEYAVIETNLYDANNEKLIWAASSEVGMFGTNLERIQSYIGAMLKTMSEQGLLNK